MRRSLIAYVDKVVTPIAALVGGWAEDSQGVARNNFKQLRVNAPGSETLRTKLRREASNLSRWSRRYSQRLAEARVVPILVAASLTVHSALHADRSPSPSGATRRAW